MKYIKKFEYRTKQPKVGDYVLVTDIYVTIRNFIENNIGQIIEIDKTIELSYCVIFENIPKEYDLYFGVGCKDDVDNCRWFARREILNFSSNKEDIEYLLVAKKYNL
jgi:hypothetical protein